MKKIFLAIAFFSFPAISFACPNLSGSFWNQQYQFVIQQNDCQTINFHRTAAMSSINDFTADIGKISSRPFQAGPDIVRLDEVWSWQGDNLELTQSMVSSSGKTNLKFVLSYSINSDGSLKENNQSYSLVNEVFVLNGSLTSVFKKVQQ